MNTFIEDRKQIKKLILAILSSTECLSIEEITNLVNLCQRLKINAYQEGERKTLKDLKQWTKGKSVTKDKVREYANQILNTHKEK